MANTGHILLKVFVGNMSKDLELGIAVLVVLWPIYLAIEADGVPEATRRWHSGARHDQAFLIHECQNKS